MILDFAVTFDDSLSKERIYFIEWCGVCNFNRHRRSSGLPCSVESLPKVLNQKEGN